MWACNRKKLKFSSFWLNFANDCIILENQIWKEIKKTKNILTKLSDQLMEQLQAFGTTLESMTKTIYKSFKIFKILFY